MTPEVFLREFGALAEMQGGVKRLRGLVLHLAFSGGLGAPGAKVCRLVDVAAIEMGNSPPGTSYNDSGEGVPLINGPVEFSPGPFGLTRRTKFTTEPTRMCRAGDSLVCVRGATTGRTNIADFDACIGRGVASVRASGDSRYAHWFLVYSAQRLLDAGTGTTFPAISRKHLEELSLPVPPLPEQKRIVKKVDQLMALCDDLEAAQKKKRQTSVRLNKSALNAVVTAPSRQVFADSWKRVQDHFEVLYDIPANVQELRRTILQLAVMGKLVRQDPTDEPAEELLEHCEPTQTELERRGAFKATKRVPRPAGDQVGFPLPAGWGCESFVNLFRFIDYRGKTPKKIASGVRLVTAKNVRMGHVKSDPAEFICRKDYDSWMTRGLPVVGDLLFTTEAPLGNVALFEFEEPVGLAQRIITLHPYCDANRRFLMYAMMSPWFQELLLSRATGMTATGIKAAKLKLLPLPVPPLAEQGRIVATVDSLMALCDDLESGLRATDARGVLLTQSAVEQLVA